MTVSAEIVTMIATGATILIAFAGGFGWLVTRMDAKFDAMDAKFDAKTDARFAASDARFDALGAKIDDRLTRVEHELTEVKIAVARLEGPPWHLLPVH